MSRWSLIEVQAIMWKAKIQFCDFCSYRQKLNTSLFPSPSPYFRFFPTDFPGHRASCATAVSNYRYVNGLSSFVLSAAGNCFLSALSVMWAVTVSYTNTVLCLSTLIPMKLKPSNSLKPLLLTNLTETGPRAKISRQRRNRQTHPPDFLP